VLAFIRRAFSVGPDGECKACGKIRLIFCTVGCIQANNRLERTHREFDNAMRERQKKMALNTLMVKGAE